MSSSLDAKTSRTVEAMIHTAMRGSKNRIAGQADQEAGGDWRQGYVDVADVVNIGEPDRRVVAARREEEPRDAPIGGRGEQADHDGDRADDRGGGRIHSAA